jgi:hypothetical protein
MTANKRNQDAPPSRPTPLAGIARTHERMLRGFAERSDRFSQLLSRSLVDETAGQTLITKSALTENERLELDALTPAAHESFLKETADTTSSLRKLLGKGDPLYVLAFLQTRNLTAPWGGYFEPTHGGLETKVELAAGLLVTQPTPVPAGPVPDRVVQQIFDHIERLIDLSTLVNMTSPRREDENADQLRFTGALNWTTIRGTSYERHGQELALDLYRPFASWSLERYGFTVDDVLAVGDAAKSLSERRQNAARRKLADALNRAPKDRSGRPEPAAIQRALEPFRTEVGTSSRFTVDDLVAGGLPRERVTAVLNELALSVASLPAESYRGLFDPSPLVERPFIEHNNHYALVIPGMVVRDTVSLLETRFFDGISTFSRTRAKTLDRLAAEHVASVLPGSRTFTNLHYLDTELDGLVLFDDRAIVIEGKGSSLSVQARRGDTVRLSRDMKRTVEEAWRQGARARNYLLGDADAVFFDDHGRELLRLSPKAVAEVFIVAPTLHELGGHAPQLPRLRALGLFTAGEYPWSVFINDLRVISETAGNAAIFLHYLRWRARLPLGDRLAVMDELDLWGCYLLSERFRALADGGHLLVGNTTTDFDDYYASQAGRGPKRRKPEKFLKGSVKAFVERMARERPAGWLQAAGVCLDLSVPEMAFIAGYEREATRAANTSGRTDITICGRLRLIAIPKDAKLKSGMTEARVLESDAILDIYFRGATGRRPEILWAEQVKPITFELSDYERAAADAVGNAEQEPARKEVGEIGQRD